MHIERIDNMLHPKLGDSGVELFCYISDAIDETLDEAMAAWGNGVEEVAISTRFTLSDALDSAIQMHEMPAYGNAIDAKAKPMFDAMRAELRAMIERIDALQFEAPKEEQAAALEQERLVDPKADSLCSTDPKRFMAIASKPHAQIAGEMAGAIKDVIYAYEKRIPLALAIGVLRIVEKEILNAA